MSGFAVRIGRGLVTTWQDAPLATWEDAEECRLAIEQATGEFGEIERLLLNIPLSLSPAPEQEQPQ